MATLIPGRARRPGDAPVPNMIPQVNTQPVPNSAPTPNLGPSMGLMGNVAADVTGGPKQDADGRGFTNPNGGHDWNVGQGPGGNWQGQDQKTGKTPIGTDPGSGDALGIPRGTGAYQAASAAHHAWIQQNLSAGLTLADLGETPTKGGGLSNFMELGSTLIPGAAAGPAVPLGVSPSTPITGGTGTFGTTKTTADPNKGNIATTSPVTGPITPALGTGLLGGDKTTTSPAPSVPVTNQSSLPSTSPQVTTPNRAMNYGTAAPSLNMSNLSAGNRNPAFGNSMGLGLGGGSLYGARRF